MGRTRLHCEVPDVEDVGDGFFLGGVEDNGDGADDAEQAAEHAKHVELLLEDDVREDGAACGGGKVKLSFR